MNRNPGIREAILYHSQGSKIPITKNLNGVIAIKQPARKLASRCRYIIDIELFPRELIILVANFHLANLMLKPDSINNTLIKWESNPLLYRLLPYPYIPYPQVSILDTGLNNRSMIEQEIADRIADSLLLQFFNNRGAYLLNN